MDVEFQFRRGSLQRDEEGRVFPNPPVLWDGRSEYVAGRHQLPREAWALPTVCGSGSFISDRWQEWNRQVSSDDVRRFLERRQRLGIPHSRRAIFGQPPTFTVTRSAKPSKTSTS